MARVIEARSKDPEILKVAGGETGLIVVTDYTSEVYFESDGEGKSQRCTKLVPKYAVDTGLLKELRAHEEQAARELGQWVEKHDMNLKAQISSTTLTLAAVMSPDELRALEQRALAAQAKQQPAIETVAEVVPDDGEKR